MKKTGLVLLMMVLMLSCTSEREKKKLLVASKGLPSELLLVVDKDVWQCYLQDSIKAIVEGQVPGLMQAEKMFRLIWLLCALIVIVECTFWIWM